jgi:hypothetical protein
MSADALKPDCVHNMRFIGPCDQGGRPYGVQIMVHRGNAYIGHCAMHARERFRIWTDHG